MHSFNELKKLFLKLGFEQFSKNAILLILGLAAFIRFTGLVKRDFWYDEAFTGVAIKENFPDMIQMIVNDVHPPLYYIVLKAFAFFFDYSVYGIRLFSAIFGLLSVWMLYLLTKELFDKKAALWASLLVAISPFAIQYSQEARMYTMLVFFILSASYFFIRGLKTGKLKFFLLWGLLTGLSMLTHYMGIIFSSLYYLVYVMFAIFEIKFDEIAALSKKIKAVLWKFVPSKNLIMGYGITFLVFLPWLRIFIHHFLMKGNNLGWVRRASLGDIIIETQIFLFGSPLGELSSGMPQPNELHGIAHISIRMVLAMSMALIIAYLMHKKRKEKVLAMLTFSIGFMLVVYLLSVSFDDQQYFVSRYMLPGAYFMFVFFAIWLSGIKLRFSLPIFCTYLFLISLIVPLKNSQGYNDLQEHISKYKNNNLYILSPFDYVICKYYFGADNLILYDYGWPQYNPSYWAAIGPSLKRTENFQDLKNDSRGVIISNKIIKDNQNFSTQDLEQIDQYKNILIYKFKN